MILPSLTTMLFLALSGWAIVQEKNFLIVVFSLLFLIINAAITLRSYRMWRRTRGVRQH